MNLIDIGDKVRDKITGFEGIVVAYTRHITGCDTVAVQSESGKDRSKYPDAVHFDVTRIELVNRKEKQLQSNTMVG